MDPCLRTQLPAPGSLFPIPFLSLQFPILRSSPIGRDAISTFCRDGSSIHSGPVFPSDIERMELRSKTS